MSHVLSNVTRVIFVKRIVINKMREREGETDRDRKENERAISKRVNGSSILE